MSMKESILNGIAKDCSNMGASIGAEKDLILVNYTDFNKDATLSPFNRQLNDDLGNKGGLTDIILQSGAQQYVFEGTDYSVTPSITTEIKENGNAWYSHSLAFTVYNKTAYARETLLSLGKARVIAITRDRSTGLYELFGAEQGLKLTGLDRAYSGAQNSNFYTVTIATPEIAVIREKSLGELSLKLDGTTGGGSTIPPDENNLEYLLSLKEDKINKGIPNGYAPLDSNAKIPALNLNIVNNLTDGGATALLSAEQGKIIGERIDEGLNNIRVERVIVIDEPVTRANASLAINSLPSFEVKDNEIPYFVTTNLEGEAGYKVELVGLGKGMYGDGGFAISASQVRITGLIDNGALGLNQILGLGSTGVDKSIVMTDSIDPLLFSTWSQESIEFKGGDNVFKVNNDGLNFNSPTLGNASLISPIRTTPEDTLNALPNVSGTLVVSVNGVFADADGNITLSPTGGSIPSWQQTLNVTNNDVSTPYMKMSNDLSDSYFALNENTEDIAFQINTPKRILFDAGVNGKIELGNGLGVLIDGVNKKVEIKADNSEGLLLDSGETGGIEFVYNTGIVIDARTQGLTLKGQIKGIDIDSGAGLNISGGLMTVESDSLFNEKLTIKNTSGLTLNTNSGDFESSIKSDNVTKDGLVFQLPNPATGTYTLATTADFVTPNLNTVLSVDNLSTDKAIIFNSTTDLTTFFSNNFDGFVLTNTVSGVTKKSTLSVDSFLYEDSSNDREQSIDSTGIKSLDSVNSTYTQITPEGLFLKQNISGAFSANLKSTYISGSSKVIQLPNVNGFLTASVNGITPDQNGNIVVSVGGGSQNLTQVLTEGDSAGGLNIQDVTDLEILSTITFNNTTATSVIKQKTGSTISGNIIIPEKTGDNILALSVNSVFPNDAGLITLPITNFTNGEDLPVVFTPPTGNYTPTSANLKGHLQGIGSALNTLTSDLSGKQSTLVSGTNIKTVNGSTLLGSGNLVTPDMDTTTPQDVSGLKTFLATKFGLRNVANTFTSFFVNTNTASRNYTLQNRNGVLADDTDLAGKMAVPSGVANYISKFLTANTIGNSRLLDTGSSFGIGVSNLGATLKDFTLGNQANREISIEESDSSNKGRDLRISAGRTIDYAWNGNFNSLSQTTRNWTGISVHPNGDVYATVYGLADIYKQTGGTGSFIALGQTARNWTGIACAPNGDVYACTNTGVYKQTGGTGAFNLTNTISATSYTNISVHPNGDVYLSTYGGDIYKQTGGTGAFNPLSQTARNYRGIACAPNGDVYATVANGDIYKQTGGTGAFNPLSQTARNWSGIACAPNGDVYASINNSPVGGEVTGDIYKQTGGTGNFIALGQPSRGISGMSVTSNSNVYACQYAGDIYLQINYSVGNPNLDGGVLKLASGTGKGTGQSRIDFITGQKTISGTDMQTETLRGYFNELGHFVCLNTPVYANDATADADTNLPSGAFYKITGNRAILQKP